ncbi:LAQU0S09e03598g1_1 [Lachancea quebecensis]|uniref:LAQU0S09e03598g1_1 n=1 Tax=Lachancea quebecensis TaxID=1654605 RepID=A0A0P1KU20_9SACH|nr:LAQU0S09e03598g1_1 [Lachancea quebecensis]
MGRESDHKKVANKLDLVAHLFLIYLSHSSLLADNVNVQVKDIGKKNIEFNINVDAESACTKLNLERCDEPLEVIVMDMSGGEKCMVSLCYQDKALKQGIFNYLRDIVPEADKIVFPLEKSQVVDYYTDLVDWNLDAKFRLKDQPSQKPLYLREREGNSSPSAVHEKLENLKFGNAPAPQSSSHSTNPYTDVPSFEDEYEIQQQPGIPVTGTFGVPGLAAPDASIGYGDQDLYPGGQKYPNLQDPSSRFPAAQRQPGQGGMIFDPFHTGQGDSRSNPLGGKGPTGPSPPFPGARFDDPFGRASRQGGGGGFI